MASAKLLTRLKSEKFTILATTVRFRPPFLPATAWFSGKGRDEKEEREDKEERNASEKIKERAESMGRKK